MNSSPPYRPTMSTSREIPRMSFATPCRIWSPARWPYVSLTLLKRSMSHIARESGRLYLRERSISSASCSIVWRRLKTVVSSSTRASSSVLWKRRAFSIASPASFARIPSDSSAASPIATRLIPLSATMTPWSSFWQITGAAAASESSNCLRTRAPESSPAPTSRNGRCCIRQRSTNASPGAAA